MFPSLSDPSEIFRKYFQNFRKYFRAFNLYNVIGTVYKSRDALSRGGEAPCERHSASRCGVEVRHVTEFLIGVLALLTLKVLAAAV